MNAAIRLTPYAGAPNLADPALTGEWADGMDAVSAVEQVPPWCSYLACRGEAAVGLGAFKAKPDRESNVEIAYITFVDARGTGVARDVAAALIDIARQEGVRVVRAHTLPEENASTRVLLANGFSKSGDVVDPEDGPVWRWERTV